MAVPGSDSTARRCARGFPLFAAPVLALLATASHGAPSFADQQTFAVGSGPHAIAAADLNADGQIDLVVVNQSGYTISVLLNTTAQGAATPTFATAQSFNVGVNPVAVAIGDLDGDGKPDIVVVNASANTLSILRNTTPPGSASVSFAAQQTVTTGSYPYSVALADLDGDGKLDLIVANVGGNSISVFRNTTAAGAATLSFAAPQTFVTGAEPSSVTVADVNGDGKPDLVVAAYLGGLTAVLVNDTAPGSTSISFTEQDAYAAGAGPVAVTTADFNGDGRPDIAVANTSDFTVSVLLNTTVVGASLPGFAAQQVFTTGVSPASVAAADVDGDGRPDLIVANQGDSTVSVLINTTPAGAQTPSFAAAQAFAAGFGPIGAIAADINSDGKPEVVVANATDDTVSVMMNTTAYAGINPNQHGITGSWFNAATGGQGLEIELYPDLGAAGQGLLFGGWFTYDVSAAGGQRWYALEGGVTSTSPTAILGIYAGYGGNFAAPPVIPATQVGTATLTFTDCSNGLLSYSFYDGRVGTIALSRLTANITCGANGDNGNAASNYPLSGSWFDASTGGQGFVFDVNPTQKNFFAAWYTYAPNGAQIGGGASERWYTIQAGLNPGDKAITGAAIYAIAGGIFNNSAAPTPAPVGTADITFQSCNAATLKYSFNAGPNAGLNGTLNLTRTGPTPEGCAL